MHRFRKIHTYIAVAINYAVPCLREFRFHQRQSRCCEWEIQLRLLFIEKQLERAVCLPVLDTDADLGALFFMGSVAVEDLR